MSTSPFPNGRPVAIVDALRTPIGRFLGGLADLTAADLGVAVVRGLLERTGVEPARVDELVFGNGRQAGGGPNPARQISVRSEIPVERPAWTLNMACGSGLKAINVAAESIAVGRTDMAVAGGTESMSRLPFFLPDMRRGYRLGHAKVVDGMYKDGFVCPLADMVMGETAEKLAAERGISRAAQDEYALSSQARCEAARTAGRFTDEITPVEVRGRRETVVVDADEHPRDGVTLEALGKLPPVFDRERGTVTAGNSSGITDGAAAVLLASAERVAELGLEPLAWVGPSAEAGVDPTIMGVGPVPALAKLAAATGRDVDGYDLVELNEAFAAQVLACHGERPLPLDRTNVNGGAIALGHPIGATGCRIVVTLLHELRRRGGERGLATLCISGGMGLATAFRRTGP